MKPAIKLSLLLFLLLNFLNTHAQLKAVPTKKPRDFTQALELVLKKPVQKTPAPVLTAGTNTNQEYFNRSTTFIPIGQSGNAYGFYDNPRTYLWVDPNLNSVAFTHRMTGGTEVEGNSRVAYDLSTDGGTTWTTNIKVYTPLGPGPQYPQAAARYPQGGILNPTGNTNPANAHYTYFCCTLDNSNGNWGGYAYGSNPLTTTNPATPSQNNLTSSGNYYRHIPDAFTITQQGKAWYIDGNYSGASYAYTGQLTLGEGEIVNGAISYTENLVSFLAASDEINDHKIAFGPDGQTGYILIMSDSDSDPQPYTGYHPVLLKTTDGGTTWSNPIHVQLGGVNGIHSIKYYWSDAVIENLDFYSSGFDRNEVWYNMGFSADIIVDKNNNPHITGIISIATDHGWYPNEGTMATWHVFSNDAGTSWDATALYDNIHLEGDIGGLSQRNRPYAASTFDGDYIFFSWIDTDLAGADDNSSPNIFVVGYDLDANVYTTVQNVTGNSAFQYAAYYGSMSQYVFTELNGGTLTCTIPFVITEYTIPGDPTQEMNFHYINGFTIDFSNYTQLPEADFSSNMTSPTITDTVNFTDLSTNDPHTWLWSFNPNTISYMDGTSAVTQNPKVKFNTLGAYTVTLIATNDFGSDTMMKTDYINVIEPLLPPETDFSADLVEPSIEDTVSFTDLSTHDPYSWAWTFDPNTVSYMDGTSAVSQHPKVIFDVVGTYTVSLIATNDYGSDTEIKTDYINASDPLAPPDTDFSADLTDPSIADTVIFTDISTNDPNAWFWSFNPNTIAFMDGSSAISQHPKVKFNVVGLYTVSLIASNDYGSDTMVKTDYINAGEILAPPVARFLADVVNIEKEEVVCFTDMSTNDPYSWLWSFNPNTISYAEGSSAVVQHPIVKFNAVGVYTVTLIATNDYGSDTKVKIDYITVNQAVSTTEKTEEELLIYPIPTSNHLNIKLGSTWTEQETYYQIMTMKGKVVMKGSFQSALLVVPTEKLSKGIHLLLLSDGKQNEIRKFIKR